MVDYDRGTGGSGTMRIRDTGSIVEFWINSNNGETYFDRVGWSWSTPNGSGNSEFGYAIGSGWIKVGSINITVDGNVSWTIGDTETWGLGGPTTQTIRVTRGTIPPAPRMIGFSDILHTTATLKFSSQGTGGLPIREWQVSFGTNGGAIEGSGNNKYRTNGTINFTGLTPDTYYAAWARGRNDKGWGPWSAPASMRTLPPLYIRIANVWRRGIFYVKVNGFWRVGIPYVKQFGTWRRARL